MTRSDFQEMTSWAIAKVFVLFTAVSPVAPPPPPRGSSPPSVSLPSPE